MIIPHINNTETECLLPVLVIGNHININTNSVIVLTSTDLQNDATNNITATPKQLRLKRKSLIMTILQLL